MAFSGTNQEGPLKIVRTNRDIPFWSREKIFDDHYLSTASNADVETGNFSRANKFVSTTCSVLSWRLLEQYQDDYYEKLFSLKGHYEEKLPYS
jgi:hypothetical protein